MLQKPLRRNFRGILVSMIRTGNVVAQCGSHVGIVDLDSSQGLTDYVFQLLRNARTLRPGVEPKIVVCWGGHSISSEEYKYTNLAALSKLEPGAPAPVDLSPASYEGLEALTLRFENGVLAETTGALPEGLSVASLTQSPEKFSAKTFITVTFSTR